MANLDTSLAAGGLVWPGVAERPANAAVGPEATAPVAPPRPAWRDPTAGRVASIDALRGLVVTLMIFVNDIADVDVAPHWLRHASPQADAMTLPDIVFPAFLFLAGMSVPLAFERARAAGATGFQLLRKIAGRTVGLLVMGALLVCVEEFNPGPRGAWGMLVFSCLLLAFVVVPEGPGPRRSAWRGVRAAAWAGLIVLALAYRTQPTASDPIAHHLLFGPWFGGSDPEWVHLSWWGIPGLIGWAYLVTSVGYLALGRRREWLVGATGLLLLVYVAASSDYPARLAQREWLVWTQPVLGWVESAFGFINALVPVGECLGSLAAVMMAGCCLGRILVPRSDIAGRAERLRWATVFAAGLFAAAVLLDPLYGLNKPHSTPAWCLLCAGITATAWIFLHGTMDGRERWPRLFQPAGANPLLAYLLHPFLYLAAGFLSVPIDFYHNPDWPLAVNVAGSAAMAMLVVQATGALGRLGFRLRA